MSTELIHTEGLQETFQVGDRPLHALRGISMQVEQGELFAIMGPSGSGKFTFLHLLGCLDRPSGGKYWLEGEEISRMDSNRLAWVRNGMMISDRMNNQPLQVEQQLAEASSMIDVSLSSEERLLP
jgi:ABC-type lipoprotein export system ATPase subunit